MDLTTKAQQSTLLLKSTQRYFYLRNYSPKAIKMFLPKDRVRWVVASIDKIENYAIEIVKHYQCPEDCGVCCRNNMINYTSKEYFCILSHLAPENQQKFRENTRKEKHNSLLGVYCPNKNTSYKNNSDECSLLVDNKCSVYNYRPRMCRPYPFDFTPLTEEDSGVVGILTCPMGIDIIFDLFFIMVVFYGMRRDTGLISVENYYECIKDNLNTVIEAYNVRINSKTSVTGTRAAVFVIPNHVSILPFFETFLKGAKLKDANNSAFLLTRMKITTFVSQHLDNNVTTPEVYDLVRVLLGNTENDFERTLVKSFKLF